MLSLRKPGKKEKQLLQESRCSATVWYFLHDARYSGPSKRILSSAKALRSFGFDASLVIPDAPDSIADRCKDLGVGCLRLKLAKIPRPSLIKEVLNWFVSLPGDFLRLWSALGKKRPDIAVVNGAFYVLPGLVAKLRGWPLVWYLNDTMLPPVLARIAGRIAHCLADVVVSQGDGVAGFHGLKAGEYVSIYSGVDLRKYPARERTPDDFRGKLKVGIVAQWAPNKGHHHFIAAARRVRDALGDRVSFVMAGSRLANQPEYQAKIDGLIRDLGLQDYVEERGFVEDVPGLMGELSLLVMASTKGDACSNATLEAMASGVPVVTTTVGSSTELVEGKGLGRAGYAVPPGDEQAMADAIINILSDPALAAEMSRAARQRVEAHFSLDEYVRRHCDVFGRLLGSA